MGKVYICTIMVAYTKDKSKIMRPMELENTSILFKNINIQVSGKMMYPKA
jgi:hypothetical protein